jgi:hypothetical protein
MICAVRYVTQAYPYFHFRYSSLSLLTTFLRRKERSRLSISPYYVYVLSCLCLHVNVCVAHFRTGIIWPIITKLDESINSNPHHLMSLFYDFLLSLVTWRTHKLWDSHWNSKLQPTRYNLSWFIYFYIRSTCFRRFLCPWSEAHNCTYSFRYCQPTLLLAASRIICWQ